MHYLCKKCLNMFREYDLSFTGTENGSAEYFYRTYGSVEKLYEESVCPNHKCNGMVIEIDELIAPTIITLNQKGWKTLFSCSGHLSEDKIRTYIMFENVPYNLPENFYAEGDCIYHKQKEFIESDNFYSMNKFNQLIEINKSLYSWALELPHFN